MSRGKKLDIFIGANIEEGWSEVKNTTASKKTPKQLTPSQHLLVFKKEKRRGKVVTLVGEFFTSKDKTKEHLKFIKKKLGCGGAFKDGWMEFQGDIKEKLQPILKELDFNLKHS